MPEPMECSRARAGLWPPERPRLLEDEVVAARRHVAECEACRDFFAQDDRLIAAHQRFKREVAPRRLRERVFDALARERAGRPTEEAAEEPGGLEAAATPGAGGWAGGWGWRRIVVGVGLLGAAALAALVVEGAPTVSDRRASGDDTGVFVEDYLRRAVADDRIESGDPAEVSRFLRRELGVPLEPLGLEGFSIEKAEICLLEGRRGAMVVYRGDEGTISHYLIPRESGTPRAPALSSRIGSTLEGMPSVVTWSDGRIEEALVADLGPEALVTVAREGLGLEPGG